MKDLLSKLVILILIGIVAYFGYDYYKKDIDKKYYFTVVSENIELEAGSEEEIRIIGNNDEINDEYYEVSSSDNDVASVNDKGIITAKSEGEVTITIKSTRSGQERKVKVKIKKEDQRTILVKDVYVSTNTISLKVGKTVKVNATVNPSNATNKTLYWKSENISIATVDNSGNITGKKIGSTKVTVKSSSGKKQTIKVTVKSSSVSVSSIELNKNSEIINIGSSFNLSYVIKPSDSSNKNVTWKSLDSSIASVDNNGKVVGKKVGSTTIQVMTNNGKKSSCKVTVTNKKVKVNTISLTESVISVTEGSSHNLVSVIKPSNATDKSITWSSSNNDIASVNNTGKVTGKKEGTAVITVKTSNGKVASCKVNVKKKYISVTGISLSTNSTNLVEGNSMTLVASINPNNATDKSITWKSSNTSVATVDKNGKVVAVKTGDAVITATAKNGITANCKVKVVSKVVEVSSISLNSTSVNILIGNNYQLEGRVSPSNATYSNITWSSSNTNIATVDQTGKITGKGVGSAKITAKTSNGKIATCKVTVNPIRVTGVTLDKTSGTLYVGDTLTLKATVAPSTATDKTVT